MWFLWIVYMCLEEGVVVVLCLIRVRVYPVIGFIQYTI